MKIQTALLAIFCLNASPTLADVNRDVGMVRHPASILCDMSDRLNKFHLEKRQGQYYLRGGRGAFQGDGMTLSDGNVYLDSYIERLASRQNEDDIFDQNGASVIVSTRQFQGWMRELESSLEQGMVKDDRIYLYCGGMLLSSLENEGLKLG